MQILVLLVAMSAWPAAQAPAAQEPARVSSQNEPLLPGKRMVAAVQFPYDQKVKFTLFPTGRAKGIGGSAEVRRRKKGIEVEVNLDEAPPASQIKPEYRGYVVWALTPAGKFVALGALEGKGSVKTTTKLPAFGIVVTAESDLKATAPTDPVLESALPEAKHRYYPIQRVYYTLAVKE
jgi:hypothetical protein